MVKVSSKLWLYMTENLEEALRELEKLNDKIRKLVEMEIEKQRKRDKIISKMVDKL